MKVYQETIKNLTPFLTHEKLTCNELMHLTGQTNQSSTSTTLSRMAKHGLLLSHGKNRGVSYSITPQGRYVALHPEQAITKLMTKPPGRPRKRVERFRRVPNSVFQLGTCV